VHGSEDLEATGPPEVPTLPAGTGWSGTVPSEGTVPTDETVVVIEDPVAQLAGGALVVRRGRRAWIVVDPDLEPAERQAAVTHELVHLERGLPPARDLPTTWQAVVAREERAVEAIAARRLVPPDGLATAVRAWLAAGVPVTGVLVAEAFDTTVAIAITALEALPDPGDRTTNAGSAGGVNQSAGSPARNDDMAAHHAAGASNCGL